MPLPKKMEALFSTDPKVVRAALESKYQADPLDVSVNEIRGAFGGTMTTITGDAQQVMFAIGAIADQGEDGLIAAYIQH